MNVRVRHVDAVAQGVCVWLLTFLYEINSFCAALLGDRKQQATYRRLFYDIL